MEIEAVIRTLRETRGSTTFIAETIGEAIAHIFDDEDILKHIKGAKNSDERNQNIQSAKNLITFHLGMAFHRHLKVDTTKFVRELYLRQHLTEKELEENKIISGSDLT